MLISEHADFQEIKEALEFVWEYLTANGGRKGQGQVTGRVALAMNAAKRLEGKPVENVEALNASLSDAADALDQVVQWMNDHALPILGDDSDGGNSLSVPRWEIQFRVNQIKNLTLSPMLQRCHPDGILTSVTIGALSMPDRSQASGLIPVQASANIRIISARCAASISLMCGSVSEEGV